MAGPADPDLDAVEASWSGFCAATGMTGRPVDVLCFGDSAAMADELADLVLVGTRRATAGALVDDAEDGVVPAVG